MTTKIFHQSQAQGQKLIAIQLPGPSRPSPGAIVVAPHLKSAANPGRRDSDPGKQLLVQFFLEDQLAAQVL